MPPGDKSCLAGLPPIAWMDVLRALFAARQAKSHLSEKRGKTALVGGRPAGVIRADGKC
jgi:hypothetical protein